MVAFRPPTGTMKDYFGKERRMLKIFGLSFTGNESVAYRTYSFVIIFFTNFMYPVLKIRETFLQDIEVVYDMLIYIFATTVALAKTIVVLGSRIQVGKMLDRLEKEPFTVNLKRGGVQEDKIFRRCIWITHAQTMVYWVCCFTTVYSTMIYILMKRIMSNQSYGWELPFGPLSILNATYSPNWEITWFYQSISITCSAVHYATIDLIMAAVLAHISYQFKMLQNNIRRIVLNSYTDMKKDAPAAQPISIKNKDFKIDASTIPWKYLHKHLKLAVEYHLEITNLTRDMEHVFSKLLFLIFLSTLGMLCFALYRSSVMQESVKILIHLQEALSACLQVLTVSFWGEQVVFESHQVGVAAYEANFVGADLRFQKGLVLIMRRSLNASKLTTGKFADVCIATFAWIMRTSYSAFMILRRMSLNRLEESDY